MSSEEQPDSEEASPPGAREPSLPSPETERRVEELAGGFLNGLRSGGTENLDELVARYPELAPHLETRLKLYRAVYQATQRTSAARPEGTSDTTAGFTADSADMLLNRDVSLRLTCPHCGNRLQVIGYNIAEVTCGSCGSSVRVDSRKLSAVGPQAQLSMPKQLGHFRILQTLGEGGFGVVFLAEDLNLDRRPVALKIPRHGFFATIEEERRFLREARNAARLRHPNIAQVYEVSEDRQTPYIVSELIDGMTLRELATSKSLSHREIAELMIQVAEAVDHAHRNGIVHRDLKSSNVLVNHERRAYVVDFGLSRRDDAELTVTIDGAVLGTVQYMAPEQAAGKQSQVGPWSDIYSLGVILYELLCRQLPFHGSKQMVINQVIIEEPRMPRSLNKSLPRDLETITLKAMSKSPPARYATAQALADDLRRWLRHEPIAARPITKLARGWRWCRRHPTVAGLSAASLGLMVASTLLSVLWAVDQTRLMKVAREAQTESDARQYQLLMQYGAAALDEEDLIQAAHWCSEALAINDEAANRLRIGMLQDQTPKLIQLWSLGEAILGMEFQGERLAAFSRDGTVKVFELRSRESLLTQKLEAFSRLHFGPLGRRFVVCGQQNYAELWDVEQERLIGRLGHEQIVTSADIHPSNELVVTGSHDASARIWNAANGELSAAHVFEGQRVQQVAFVPESDLVAVVTEKPNQLGNSIHVWNHITDQIVASGMEHAAHILTFDFSQASAQDANQDARRICSAASDGQVQVWNLAGERVGQAFKLPFAPKRVLFGGSAEKLVAITHDFDVQLWDIGTGQRVGPEIRNHQAYSTVTQDSRNRLLAMANTEGTVRVYWRRTGKLACSPLKNSQRVTSLAFHADGRQLAVGGSNGMLQLWDLAGSAAEAHVFSHQGAVRNALYTPDGERCLTIGLDGQALLWDADTGQQLGAAMEHAEGIADCALSRDGSIFATAGNDQVVRFWSGFNGESLGSSLKHGAAVCCLAFRADGHRLITGCVDGTVHGWDCREALQAAVGSENAAPLFTGKHEARVMSVAFSPRGELVASASLDGFVRCWNADTGNQQNGPFSHERAAYCLFLPTGTELLSCGADGYARIWTLPTDSLAQSLRCDGAVRSANWFEAGAGVLTNDNRGKTRIWRRQGSRYNAADTLQHDSLESVYFSNWHPQSPILAMSGGSLAVGSGIPSAGGAVLWHAGEERWLGPPLKHFGLVRRVTFSPQGDSVLTASEDGTARLWKLISSSLPTRELIRIARLYSQQQLDALGRLRPMTPREQLDEFEALSSSYPTAFRCGVAEIQRWEEDAERLETAGQLSVHDEGTAEASN